MKSLVKMLLFTFTIQYSLTIVDFRIILEQRDQLISVVDIERQKFYKR